MKISNRPRRRPISRRRPILAALALLVAAAPIASAQTLKHEKYKLANGLTVILHEDHALPTATINLWYRVGAKNEPAGRSGFAHLFEHLMFMGTKRVPDGQFDALMEAGGGNNNATTDLDRTNYFSEGPAELLPTLLWLDADRLEAIGANMTAEKLDRQRDIVRNEIRQNVENTPYGRAYDAMFRLMYPAGHPYHNAVYGTHEDLAAADVNDVRDFFATFYAPANCSLVVAGDFDPAVVRPQVEALFGSLPAGHAPRDRAVEPARLDRVVRSTMLDKVEQPKLLLVHHAPGQYQPGDAEATLAARVLGDPQTGRLYKRLVLKDQSCVRVVAFPYPGQLQSLLLIDASVRPGADLAAVERAIDEEVARLRDEGPTPDELAQRRSTLELEALTSLQALDRRADRLNEYEYYFGEPDSLQRDLDRFRKATADGVRKAVRDVMTPEARLVLTVLPEEGAAAGSPRDATPAPATRPAAFAVPTPETFALASGATVVLFPRPGLPLVSARLLVKPAGATLDPAAKAGRAELLAQMMGEGTGDLDGPAFAAALQALGAEVDAGAGRTALTSSLTALDRNFAAAAKLWLDATLRPRLLGADLDRLRTLQLAELEQADQEPGLVAAKLGQLLLYGRGTDYGVPADGTAETVAGVTMDDLKRAQAELLAAPERLRIFVAGNVTADQVRAALDPLLPKAATSAAATPTTAVVPEVAPAEGMRVAIVDRPDAPQTAVRLVAPGVAYADAGRVPLELLNTVLGGSFTSRLNANLREAKGYTYGAGSRFAAEPRTGFFVASADVKSDVTGPAVKELLAELRRIGGGDVSDAELTKARQSYRARLVDRFGTLQALLGTASSLAEAGVPFASLAADMAAADAATVERVNEAARRYPRLDRAVLVLVGDERLIRAQIKELGLPEPTSYDASGTPAAK